MKTYIEKIKKTPFKIFTKKVEEKIYFFFRGYYIRWFPIDMKGEEFENFQSKCNFLFDDIEKSNYINSSTLIEKKSEIVKDADKICAHVFNLLGSGDKKLGSFLPWKEDFKTGFKWENKFYKNIKIIDYFNNADVKVPWELSRFQHIFTLGKAYWLTKDEKYTEEFRKQILDWIKENPVEMSVNWTCTMDVAIRAINWITGAFFFKNSNVLLKDFWITFNKSLYLHGKYIIKNLENKSGYTGNHYLSDIAGLVWIGIYFKDFTEKKAMRGNNPELWLKYGVEKLESEMFVQVNEDGTHYEASTAYHRLVTEIFLITTILCIKNNIKFSKQYRNRLEKMCEFIMHIVKPNGLSPIIGDADDGRFIIFSRYTSWVKSDFRYILAIAGEFFNRDDLRYFGKGNEEEALWCVGSFKQVIKVPNIQSMAFKEGGYYILRNERIYCILRCGRLAMRGQGGHSHNDQLSFEMNIDGEDIIMDPGAFVYTSDYKMRNLYRSTEVHNTIKIEDYEQNDFEKLNLFEMKEQTYAECTRFDCTSFEGKHYGYKNKCDIVHFRKVCLSADSVLIIDFLEGEKNRKFTFNLSLNCGIQLKALQKGYILTSRDKKIMLLIKNKNYYLQEKETKLSRSYGTFQNTKGLSIEVDSEKEFEIQIKILEGENKNETSIN